MPYLFPALQYAPYAPPVYAPPGSAPPPPYYYAYPPHPPPPAAGAPAYGVPVPPPGAAPPAHGVPAAAPAAAAAEQPDFASMSVLDLRQYIASRGATLEGAIEKADLVAIAKALHAP